MRARRRLPPDGRGQGEHPRGGLLTRACSVIPWARVRRARALPLLAGALVATRSFWPCSTRAPRTPCAPKIFRTASDGSKELVTGRWWDSQRNEECTFQQANTPDHAQLCLPDPCVGLRLLARAARVTMGGPAARRCASRIAFRVNRSRIQRLGFWSAAPCTRSGAQSGGRVAPCPHAPANGHE